MSSARERIMARLVAANARAAAYSPDTEYPPVPKMSARDKVQKLKGFMEAVKAEVHVVPKDGWAEAFRDAVKGRGWNRILHSPETREGKELESVWDGKDKTLPPLATWEGSIEDFKAELFETDAAVTSTIGGIAETGVLALWPDEREPRLMSLVPSVHIAVLEADKIYATFGEMMEKMHWAGEMPTNALLISGPSRTADIELVLTFGVHGPKEVIVFILE